MVLAKSGAASDPAISAISARCAAMPRSKAGGKCWEPMRSKGGRPNGVVQVSKNGFSVIGSDLSALNRERAEAGGGRRHSRTRLPAQFPGIGEKYRDSFRSGSPF